MATKTDLDHAWEAWLAEQERKSVEKQRELAAAIMADGPFRRGQVRQCQPAPLGCGQEFSMVAPRPGQTRTDDGHSWDDPPEGKPKGFRNILSMREAQITGLCQECQDQMERKSIEAELEAEGEA